MSNQTSIDDDNLALYALGLLSPLEQASMEVRLASDQQNRLHLSKIQTALGIFAEAAVEMKEVPDRSLNRLMTEIAKQSKPAPKLVQATHGPGKTAKPSWARNVLPWAGWALAAGLVCAVGLSLHPRQVALNNEVAELKYEVNLQTDRAARAEAQRTAIQHVAELQTQHAASADVKVSEADQRAAALRSEADRALAKASTAAERAENLALTANQTAKERDALASSLQVQTQRGAELASESADAQLILNALKDPTALSVSLKVPKQKRTPSGRGTYVASSGALIFVGNDLPRLSGNRVYELWLMPSSGASPIPAGTFVPDADGRARIVSPRFRPGVAANGFAVTAEKAGGSATPTLPILLTGS